MLEMKRLRLLWELSARGTVAAVADALNYSPSAVSQQLALLEREAGVPLLRKVGRTLELTAAGLTLVSETEELLAGLERAEAALHVGHAEVAGTVAPGVASTGEGGISPGANPEEGGMNGNVSAEESAAAPNRMATDKMPPSKPHESSRIMFIVPHDPFLFGFSRRMRPPDCFAGCRAGFPAG